MLMKVVAGALLLSVALLVPACEMNTGIITSASGPGLVAATPREGGADGGSIVLGTKLAVGSTAPDIMFESPKGHHVSLTANRAPVAVVAFVGSPADDPCWLEPRVMSLAARFEQLPITVVQISEIGVPAAQCKPPRLMKILIDSGQVAWNAYGRPAPGTVYVLDRHNRVEAIGTLDDLEPVTYTAGSMGLDERRNEWPADLND